LARDSGTAKDDGPPQETTDRAAIAKAETALAEELETQMMTEQALLEAILRTSFSSFIEKVFYTVKPGHRFVPNWHIDVVADLAEQCTRGRLNRLLINLPPRSLKSIIASVALPAFILGHDPTARIICVSYGQTLADDLAKQFRLVMASKWYRDLFPDTQVSPLKDTATETTTTAGGFRLATSIGGALTGRGGDWIIIDDPSKPMGEDYDAARENANQWFDQVCYSRLDSKADGVIIVVMQRLNVADLTGHLLAKGSSWRHLSLAAIAEADESFKLSDGRILGRRVGEALHPEREDVSVLRATEEHYGGLVFSAQYQQAPVPPDGSQIKLHWFRRYEVAPDRQPGDVLTHSWDTASKTNKYNDYSVCTVWLTRGADHYLIAVHRERLDYPGLKRKVIELAQRDRPDQILIEDMSSGTQLIQELCSGPKLRPIGIRPKTDSLTRAFVYSGKISSGCIHLPVHAPWLDVFIREVAAFPKSRFDDQIDSMMQFLSWISDRKMPDAPFVIVESEIFRSWEEEFGPIESAASALPGPGRY
jgi:predicted phage terminase large subunit-like protein